MRAPLAQMLLTREGSQPLAALTALMPAGLGNPAVTRLLSDPCVRNVERFPTGFGNSESQGQARESNSSRL